MRRGSFCPLLLLLAACDGREVSVFELPARVEAGGAAGSAGTNSVSPSGGTAGAAVSAPGAASSPSAMGGAASASAGGSLGGSVAASAGMAGAAGAPPVPCATDADCAGWVCEKTGCDAPSGFCVPWPPFCLPDLKPVCGCDGVTYWNDCFRQQAPMHAQLAAPGVCSATACACEVGADCNVPYASCAHLMAPGEMCGHGMGACWVLPPQCGPSNDSKMWGECKPPDGAPAKCLDTCSAIATEHSYAELHRGDSCN